MGNNWKHAERRVAGLLGGKRLPVNGRGQIDVDAGWCAVEVKSRKSIPAWLKKAVHQARTGARPDQFPVVVVHETGSEYLDAVVVMSMRDFVDWYGSPSPDVLTGQ